MNNVPFFLAIWLRCDVFIAEYVKSMRFSTIYRMNAPLQPKHYDFRHLLSQLSDPSFVWLGSICCIARRHIQLEVFNGNSAITRTSNSHLCSPTVNNRRQNHTFSNAFQVAVLPWRFHAHTAAIVLPSHAKCMNLLNEEIIVLIASEQNENENT